jgi:hypothetical protein
VVDGGDGGRAAARGRALHRWQKGKQRSRRGLEEGGGDKVQGLMWKIEKIQGLPCKVKFPVDLNL